MPHGARAARTLRPFEAGDLNADAVIDAAEAPYSPASYGGHRAAETRCSPASCGCHRAAGAWCSPTAARGHERSEVLDARVTERGQAQCSNFGWCSSLLLTGRIVAGSEGQQSGLLTDWSPAVGAERCALHSYCWRSGCCADEVMQPWCSAMGSLVSRFFRRRARGADVCCSFCMVEPNACTCPIGKLNPPSLKLGGDLLETRGP